MGSCLRRNDIIMDDKALRRAKNIAYHFLAARPRSLTEVCSRLEKKEIPPEIIEKAVEELKGFGYIDDQKFAASYARYLIEARGLSRYALRYELKKKGVAEEDIEAALYGLEDEAEDEEAVARRLAEKKMASMRGVDGEKARRRVSDYLRRKGYSFRVIQSALKNSSCL